MMELKCNYLFKEQTQSPTITVGELFESHCKLPSGTHAIELEKLKVKPADEATKYQVVIVRSAQSGDNINFAMTSYLVGPKDLSALVLTDGTQDYVVSSPLKFEVKSILSPNQKPEMFGPMAGLSVAVPMVYWVLLATIIFISIVTLSTLMIRRYRRKKMLQRLNALEDGTQPLQQYFAVYRRLQREHVVFNSRSDVQELTVVDKAISNVEYQDIIDSIEKSLKLFIARVFRISAIESSWKVTVSSLHEEHPIVSDIMATDLNELGREFRKIRVGKNRIEAKDVILISEKARRWVEKADQLQKAIVDKDIQAIKKLRGTK